MVIGASGRLGRALRRNWPRETPARWTSRRAGPGLLACDPLRDPAGLAALAAGAGALVCLAGVTPAGAAAGGDWADNTRLALAALEAGAAAKAPVILCSSAAVYGRAGGVLDETRAPTPAHPYGAAKAEMEAAVLNHAREHAQEGGATILRIGNVAGADAALGGWRAGFALDVFADGATPARSYIGPATLARVLAGLLERLRAGAALPGILNVAQPGPVEMGALLTAAGLAWTPRPAPAEAIARVELATDRLAALVPLPPADAAGLVAEWRADRA